MLGRPRLVPSPSPISAANKNFPTLFRRRDRMHGPSYMPLHRRDDPASPALARDTVPKTMFGAPLRLLLFVAEIQVFTKGAVPLSGRRHPHQEQKRLSCWMAVPR